MSTATIEKPAGAPAGETTAPVTADAPKETTTAPVTEKPAADPVADAGKATDKPADMGKATSFLDEVADGDEDDEAPADKTAEETAKDADGKDKATDPTWRQDWREAIAGGDEKRLAALKRFATPEAMAKSYFALQQKLSSAEYKKAPGEDATPEELAAWRADNAIPDAPDKYALPEIPEFEWSDDDRAAAAPLFERLHKKNTPQPVIDEVMGYYADLQKQTEAKVVEIDHNDKTAAEEHMLSTYGNEYKPTLALMKRFYNDKDAFPPELRDALLAARTPDGKRLANMPPVLDFIAQRSRETYGDGGMLYGDAKVELTSRKNEILKVMNEDIGRYYREGLADEYATILQKESGGKKRS